MRAFVDSANGEFLFARIHAKWSRALTPDKILRILSGSSGPAALEEALKATGLATATLASAPRVLGQRFVEELSGIRSQLDSGTGLYYSCFIDRFFLDNLLILLSIRQNPAHRAELAPLLLESRYLPELRTEPLLQADSASQMMEMIPSNPFQRRLRPMLKEFDVQKDLFLAECRLESLFYATLANAAANLPGEYPALAARLLGSEIDIAHILLLLRNVTTYKLPAERLESLFYGQGRLIRKSALAGLARLTEPDMMAAALPGPYARILKKAGAGNLAAVEDALWSSHYQLLLEPFRNFMDPESTLIAFPLLKRCELRNTIRLLEGLRLGLKPDEIRESVIGAPHV